MTVSDANRIDVVLSKDGRIILAMFVHRPWDSGPDLREDLRRKILAYVGYIRSDDYRTTHGDAEAAILVLSRDDPPEEIRTFEAKAAKATGVEITFDRMVA